MYCIVFFSVMEVSVIKMSSTRKDVKLPIKKYEQGPSHGYHDFSLPLDGVTGVTSSGKWFYTFHKIEEFSLVFKALTLLTLIFI